MKGPLKSKKRVCWSKHHIKYIMYILEIYSNFALNILHFIFCMFSNNSISVKKKKIHLLLTSQNPSSRINVFLLQLIYFKLDLKSELRSNLFIKIIFARVHRLDSEVWFLLFFWICVRNASKCKALVNALKTNTQPFWHNYLFVNFISILFNYYAYK